jgi:hypothetical protein
MLTAKELEILKQQIGQAMLDAHLNGADKTFLVSMRETLDRLGTQTDISENERNWLDHIFLRSGIDRDPRASRP